MSGKQVFKVTTFCVGTCFQSFQQITNYVVHHALCFLICSGVYTRSFCEFISGATVNNFSLVRKINPVLCSENLSSCPEVFKKGGQILGHSVHVLRHLCTDRNKDAQIK